MFSSWDGKAYGIAIAVALAAALPGCGGGGTTEETAATDGGGKATETAPESKGGDEKGDTGAEAGGAPAYDVFGDDWLRYSHAERRGAAEDYIADHPRLCEGANPRDLAVGVTESYRAEARINVPAFRFMKDQCRQDQPRG